jgi:rhamnogalacturonan endolyase
MVVKTAPGTVDGEGNFVLMESEAETGPAKIWYNTDNVPDKAQGHVLGETPEYLTVFDGATGRELKTVKHPLPYNVVKTWGDSYGGRSDRYLAGAAYLDGQHPSIVWCRGYYYSASVAAVDWDGTDLTTRWVHTSETAGQGIYNEGAHSLVIADVDDDGKDEIVYGAGTLDDDGTCLYRTGLGHGDALHVSDFDLNNPGKEVFMVHEEGSHGYDLHDAKTGAILLRETAAKDTGRGLIGDFSKAHKGSEYLVFTPFRSVVSTQEEKLGDIFAESWALGQSGAAPNNRIYWDGDLQSEFYDKNIVASWNDDINGWDRYKFSGENYVPGNENNGTKRNPIVMGDLFGDWREEIVLWEAGEPNNFVITATDIPTEYMIPTLRDDRQYDEAIVWQNVGYNQPPHLSFDLYTTYGGGSSAVKNVAAQTTDAAAQATRKMFRNGKLVIVSGDNEYNTIGQKVR